MHFLGFHVSMKILEVKGLTKHFGGLTAVHNVSFSVDEGEIVAIIGPNGAGKTTLFNLISGLLSADHGKIFLKVKPIQDLRAHERCKMGIGRTFQTPRVFGEMTVLDNFLIGAHPLTRSEVIVAGLRFPSVKREETQITEKARGLLKWLSMDSIESKIVKNLPFGNERFLEIGRALMADPTLLLLDEPGGGLNTFEIEQLKEKLREIRKKGVTILLIEHDMELVMGIAERIIVLNFGTKIAEGTPEEIKTNKDVIMSYLGEEYFND
jgi:branched-chain amino acid transport system ATP-binding protein